MDIDSHPVAGTDYPRTFQEMEQRFRDEAACRDYIRRLRWPEGFVCPHCRVKAEPWTMSGGLLRCRSCQARTSLTAGTIFEGTRKPLRTWFMAMWLVTSQKNGASALRVQRVLGLGSYETAWTWLHKLRRAMVRPGRDLLSGVIEVDETYVGAAEKGKWGREVESRAIVAIAAEENGKGIGRIRLRRIADVSAESLLPFVARGRDAGHARAHGRMEGICGVEQAGFEHRVSIISASPDPAHVVMPRVHRIAALLRRWLLGTHQGGVKTHQLDYYLDEFTFRFNRRRSKARGLLFHRLAEQAVAVAPAPYRSITGKPPNPGTPEGSGQ